MMLFYVDEKNIEKFKFAFKHQQLFLSSENEGSKIILNSNKEKNLWLNHLIIL